MDNRPNQRGLDEGFARWSSFARQMHADGCHYPLMLDRGEAIAVGLMMPDEPKAPANTNLR